MELPLPILQIASNKRCTANSQVEEEEEAEAEEEEEVEVEVGEDHHLLNRRPMYPNNPLNRSRT